LAKLLIPSRNRPTSLANVLNFISHFYPGQDIIIADGSTSEYKILYRKLLKNPDYNVLNIEYRPFDSKISIIQRILAVLCELNDQLIIMGADDDYPLLDTLQKGEVFLSTHADYSTAMGSSINLYLLENGPMKVRLGVSRPIESSSIVQRVRDFAEWSFSTTYAVTRREVLIARYQRADSLFLANFYDYNVGIHDCMAGKIKAIKDVGFFCTRNYRHSYIRPNDNLIYLRRGTEVLKFIESFRNDLLLYSDMHETEAQNIAKKLVRERIAQLAGGRVNRRHGFSKSPLFKNSHIQYQYNNFHGLFSKHHPERKRLLSKLEFIVNALKKIPGSNDNHGERKTSETLGIVD